MIVAHHGEMIGLTDRIRLRPLTVGEKGDMLYLSSEESGAMTGQAITISGGSLMY